MDATPLKTEIEAALRNARKHDGLKPRKLLTSPLLDLVAVKREVADSGATPPAAAVTVIKRRLLELGPGIRHRALANALNIEGKGADSLGGRRRAFGDNHQISPDTVENYENEALLDLVEMLLDNPGHREVAPAAEERGETPGGSETLMDNAYYHWRAIRVDSTYIFDTGRTPTCFEVVRDMEALRETDRYVVRFKWSGGGDPPLVIDEGGKIVRRLPPSIWGFTLHEIDLERVFVPGEPHRIRYHVEIGPTFEEPRPFVTYAPTEHVGVFVQRIRFGDNVPNWIYRIVAPFADFPYAAVSRNRAFVDSDGNVEATFEDLEPGLSYGFWWEWQ